MALNINSATTDPFYRYKMPKLQVKIEGKGNGIKTVLSNITDIASTLLRPATYPTKFFAYSLGVQFYLDAKNDRYILSGEHDANKLQNLLDNFIKNFVLCPTCDNPESVLKVEENHVRGYCNACGEVFFMDKSHKLSTYMIKNPPIKSSSEALKKHSSMKSMINAFNNLTIEDQSIDARLDSLYDFFLKAKKDKALEKHKMLVDEAKRLDLLSKAPLLLTHVIFDEDIIAQLANHQALFYHFLHGNFKAQRYFWGGITQVIQKYQEKLMPVAPDILASAYQLYLLELDVILEWAITPRSKFVDEEFNVSLIFKCKSFTNRIKEVDDDEI